MFLIFNNEKFFEQEWNWWWTELINFVIEEIKKNNDENQEMKDLNNLKEKYWRNIMILNSNNQIDNIMMKSWIFNVFKYFEWWNCMIYTATLAMKLKKLWLTEWFKVVEWYFLMKNKNWISRKDQHTYIIDRNNNIIDYTYFQFRHFQNDLNQWKYSVSNFNEEKWAKKIYTIDEYLERLKNYKLEVVFQNNIKWFYLWKPWVEWWIDNQLVKELNEFWIIKLINC